MKPRSATAENWRGGCDQQLLAFASMKPRRAAAENNSQKCR